MIAALVPPTRLSGHSVDRRARSFPVLGARLTFAVPSSRAALKGGARTTGANVEQAGSSNPAADAAMNRYESPVEYTATYYFFEAGKPPYCHK